MSGAPVGPDEIRDNTELHRFELAVEGHVAFVTYSLKPGVITYVHTEVPKEIGGRGIATRLAMHVLDHARAAGLRVISECPVIAAYIKRHPDYADLLPRGMKLR